MRIPPILIAFVASTAASYAGQELSTGKDKEMPPAQPCYKDFEWTVDMFGSYFTAEHRKNGVNDDHAWGGGVDVNYFFLRHYGIGVEGSLFDLGDRGYHSEGAGFVNLNVYYRFPIEGRFCWAPYLFAGGGWEHTSNNDNIHGHVGFGADFRLTQHFGLFMDGRYTWTGGPRVNNDFGMFRAGVNFVF